MAKLPEPNFIERNPNKITKEWIELYEQKSGKVLQPAQIERLMVDVGAYRETVLRMKIQETAKQNLLSYSPLEILEHIGEPLGVTKLLANSAKTTLKFSVEKPLDFDFRISKGTEIETKNGLFIFQTTSDTILKTGELSVEVESVCETAGAGGNNYIIGSINNLITPLSYISTVENTTISSGGADDEDADSLRERIRQAPEKFSNAGSRGAYRYHTLSAHQSITDVAITSPLAGIDAFCDELLKNGCKITAPTIYGYEGGQRQPSVSYISGLIKVYDANPFWLLQGVGEMFVSEEDKSKANMPANIDLSNTVFIPVVNMDVSAGFGSLTEEIESTKDFVSFGKDWIKKHISANVNNLVMFTVRGDSMDGGNSRIKNGSQIIVDTSVKEYINDGIYAIRIENALFVKRLQYMPGKLLVKSDNPIYQPFEVDLKTDSVNIIGAVVYVMNDMSCI